MSHISKDQSSIPSTINDAKEAFKPPKWVREIQRFRGVKSQFVLTGNIYDIYPYELPDGSSVTSGSLNILLKNVLQREGYKYFFEFQPFKVTSLINTTKDESINQLIIPREDTDLSLISLTTFIKNLVGYNKHAAILINYFSRLSNLADINLFLYELFRLSQIADAKDEMFNLVFFAIDNESDLPQWYANSRIMNIPIPRPDHLIRRYIINNASSKIKGFKELKKNEPSRHKDLVNRFTDQTGGLFASEIVSIAQLAIQDKLDFSKISDAVRHYKLGVPDNPWAKLSREVILEGDKFLTERVIGQNKAVYHSLDVIKRSIYDLSGSQFSPHAQKPKGVLFFAGPTGVGKTELAKSITELIFGSPENYVRFDMSEFNQIHSDQRLLGAPPGYVGFEGGGELTNAIKQKPFTLILFDEIEKAHPKIMDIFLQVLDDGRLTSGRGETVYFSDAVIVFTTNLGVYQENESGDKKPIINPDMPYSEVESKITNAINNFFTFTLRRPEILNRIGKNIVVFDFIRPDDAQLIYQKMLRNVLIRLEDKHKISILLDEDSQKVLGKHVTLDLSMGGRGIGNSLEELFVNPLSRELYSFGAEEGANVNCHVDIHESLSPQIILKLL
jgi:ATP-dependent Clp protease ATP-binding subunit ClpA